MPLTALRELISLILGDVPQRGALKLIGIGALIVLSWVAVRDFKNEIKAESSRVRFQLTRAFMADSLMLESQDADRAKLLKRTNARLRRLYEHNGWVYEEIEP